MVSGKRSKGEYTCSALGELEGVGGGIGDHRRGMKNARREQKGVKQRY